MDALERLEAVRECLRAGGFGPGRVLVRSWWGGTVVDLRDDSAAEVRGVLVSAGWDAVAAGDRVVMIWDMVD